MCPCIGLVSKYLWNLNIWNKVSGKLKIVSFKGGLVLESCTCCGCYCYFIMTKWLKDFVAADTCKANCVYLGLEFSYIFNFAIEAVKFTCHSDSGGEQNRGQTSRWANRLLAATSPDPRIWNRTQRSLGPRGQPSCSNVGSQTMG